MGLKVDGVTSKLKFKVGYHVNAMETPREMPDRFFVTI